MLSHKINFIISSVFAFSSLVVANSNRLLNMGSPDLRSRTIAQSDFIPGNAPGQVVSNVNLLTGQPSYSIPVGGISARGQIGYSFSLGYSGGTQHIVGRNNESTPTGWVGLGWSLQTPSVSVNHKGTVHRGDDVYYCSLGPYGGGQILTKEMLDENNDPYTKYFIATNPYIQISTILGSGSKSGQIVQWTFVFPDGKKMVFGGAESSGTPYWRTMLAVGNSVKVSPESLNNSFDFIYKWDVRTFSDFMETSVLHFEHQYVYREVNGTTISHVKLNNSYVREGYLQKVYWKDILGNEVDRLDFVLSSIVKSAGERASYGSYGAYSQKLYETQYLDFVARYESGFLANKFNFETAIVNYGAENTPKRMLNNVHFNTYSVLGASDVQGWRFSYLADIGLLNKVEKPNQTYDTFTYKQESLNYSTSAQDISDKVLIDKNGDEVVIPEGEQENGWTNNATCVNNICYQWVQRLNGAKFSQRLVLNVYTNNGNSFRRSLFDKYPDNPSNALDKAIDVGLNENNDWEITIANNYFIVSNDASGYFEMWELNSNGNFERRFNEFRGFDESNQVIKVRTSSNYFIILADENGDHVVPHIYLRNPDSGVWKRDSRSAATCGYDNKAAENDSYYGEKMRYSTTSGVDPCIDFYDWDNSELIVDGDKFIFFDLNKHIFAIYHLNADYNYDDNQPAFLELTKKDALGNFAIDVANLNFNTNDPVHHIHRVSNGVVHPNNYDWVIENITFRNNMLILEVNRDEYDYYFWFNYDGERYELSHYYPRDDGDNNKTSVFYVMDNYVLEHHDASERAYVYLKHSIGGATVYVKQITDIAFADNARISVHPKAFSVSDWDPINTRANHHPSKPNHYRSYLYKVNSNGIENHTNEIPEFISDLRFSSVDNSIFGTSLTKNGGRCSTGDLCSISAKIFEIDLDGSVVLNANVVDEYWVLGESFSVNSVRFKANRFIVQSTILKKNITGGGLQANGERAVAQLLQFAGSGYSTPESQYVVEYFSSNSGVGNASEDVNVMNFEYGLDADQGTGSANKEFNSNTLQMYSGATRVKQCKTQSNCQALGSTLYQFYVDGLNGGDYTGIASYLQGQVFQTKGKDLQNRDRSYSENQSMYYHNDDWPLGVYVPRSLGGLQREFSPEGSHHKSKSLVQEYDEFTGSPLVTRSWVEGGTGNLGSFWNVSHTELTAEQEFTDPHGDKYKFKYPSQSEQFFYAGSETDQRSIASLQSSQNITGASKPVFSTSIPFLPTDTYVWRGYDAALTDAQLIAGTTPTFDLNSGWIKTSETEYNNLNQPKEVKGFVSTTESISSCTIYEGPRSLPVATFTNAPCANVMYFGAENGNAIGKSGASNNNDWSIYTGFDFRYQRPFTGVYALRTEESFGPTKNVYLQDVAFDGFDYIVSVWMYSSGTTAPILMVERHLADGSLTHTMSQRVPAGGNYTKKLWERYELVIPNSWIKGGDGAFASNTSGGYLRIWAGNSGSESNVVYVDEFIGYPSDAGFSTTAYDKRGRPSANIDANHTVVRYERDMYGNVTATRDENFKIFSQSATHRLGENGIIQEGGE